MAPEQSADPHLLDAAAQQSVADVFDLIDPPLWLVTAAHAGSRGGFIATFAVRASIVRAIPRVVLGVARQHHTWGLIESSGRFALHLLYTDQLDLVYRFGMASGREDDKFHGLATTPSPGGSPLVTKALAWLDCRVEERMVTGDRTVYLAAVEAAHRSAASHALTAGGLFANAPEDCLRRLDELYARDGEIDQAAILHWRKQHGV
jgi:flavin reductase (DIM6/NTAB) family NADH-FMN oxidoreductase RutF